MSYSPSRTVDATGLICPEPIMMLHNAVRDIKAGEIVELIATDPATPKDVTQFCEFLGHVLLDTRSEEGKQVFFIEKKT